jgi:hypothetical protein
MHFLCQTQADVPGVGIRRARWGPGKKGCGRNKIVYKQTKDLTPGAQPDSDTSRL